MSVSYNFGTNIFPSSNKNFAVNAAAVKSDPAQIFPEHVDPPGVSLAELHEPSNQTPATDDFVQPMNRHPVHDSEGTFKPVNLDSVALDAQLEECRGIHRQISAAAAHGRTLSFVTVEYLAGSWRILKSGTGLVLLSDTSQDSLRILASQSLEIIRSVGSKKLYFCRANYTNVDEYLSYELRIEATLAMLPRVELEVYDGEAVANWSAKSPRHVLVQFSVEGIAKARAAALARMIAQRKSQEM